MSEPTGTGPEDVRRSLMRRSVEDEALRQRLPTVPKATIAKELGARLPEGIGIRGAEETPGTD